MDKIYDFSGCRRIFRTYGGSDRKQGIVYDGDVYMLKHPENHTKKSEISSSYVNRVLSEYISSHIAESTGLPTHKTVLGIYKDEVVVGCKDFREANDEHIIEFVELQRIKYDSSELKRQVLLSKIYDTLFDEEVGLSKELQIESVRRYWDTFVVDALVGNNDRHSGNWAYIEKCGELTLAPTYDYGSTLYPILAEEGMEKVLESDFEVLERCLVSPSPNLHITQGKDSKIGYYDMLASNYDQNCTDALLRMAPRIDMDKVCSIVDETPFISDTRKNFYKTMLSERKAFIIDRAYARCVSHDFDMDALAWMTEGRPYTTKDLERDMDVLLPQRQFMPTGVQREYLRLTDRLSVFQSREYLESKILAGSRSPEEASVKETISTIERKYPSATGKYKKISQGLARSKQGPEDDAQLFP